MFQSESLIRHPIVELVPDGVASVRITYREAPPMVASVDENAFSFTPPPPGPHASAELKRLEPKVVSSHLTGTQRRSIISQWNQAVNQTAPTKIEWLDATGAVVRIINPPNPRRRSTTSVGDLDAPAEGP